MNHAAALPHLHDLPPFDPSDAACMAELQAVLARHGKASRFGVGLLHRHFALADHERLVETVDEATRTLTVRPVEADALPEAKPSQWQLTPDGPQPILWCYDKLGPHA